MHNTPWKVFGKGNPVRGGKTFDRRSQRSTDGGRNSAEKCVCQFKKDTGKKQENKMTRKPEQEMKGEQQQVKTTAQVKVSHLD